MNKILLKVDSRDKIYSQKFGQVGVDLPEEYNSDRPLFDEIQPVGSVECVAYTICDIAEDQDGIEYDIDDLWKRVPKNQFGSDPRDVLKEVINNGLLPKGGTERVKKWKSFWRADVGAKTPFENVRSAIYLSQSPIMMATYWYSEWLNVPNMGIMPVGKNALNGHAYSNEGWIFSKVSVVGKMFLIEPWVGRKMLMPMETFNEALKVYGTQTWVLSTSEIDEKRQKTILEAIRDTLLNVVLLMKQLLLVKKTEAGENIVVPKPDEVYNEVKQSMKLEKLYDVSKSLLGKRLTLDKSVPINVGCAQAVSYVLREAGYKIPKGGISGTYTLYEWLQKNFTQIDKPEKGCIVISPTTVEIGHVGICGELNKMYPNDYAVMSNDSITGKYDTQWRLENWKKHYKKLGTFYFKP